MNFVSGARKFSEVARYLKFVSKSPKKWETKYTIVIFDSENWHFKNFQLWIFFWAKIEMRHIWYFSNTVCKIARFLQNLDLFKERLLSFELFFQITHANWFDAWNLCNFYEICQFIIRAFQLHWHAMRQKRTRLAAPGQLKKRNESIKSREIFGKNPQSSSILVWPPTVMKIWEMWRIMIA